MHYNPTWYEHHFAYWDDEGNDMLGVMLTSTERNGENLPLQECHIAKDFEFKYLKPDGSPTFIVPAMLIKNVKMRHLRKTGELTEGGIIFIESISGDLEYKDWSDFTIN